MNRPLDVSRALLSVDLAREPEFRIGSLRVCPSQRQIMAAGRQETVQPRVMQVLVALARAQGAVVSREQLIESCWDGVVVGDDAINRSIAKVREIAEFAGTRHFTVETIARVGYRLSTPAAAEGQISPQTQAGPESPPRADGVPAAAASTLRRHGYAAIGAGILVAAIAAALVARIWLPVSRDIGIAVIASGAPIRDSLAAELENIAGARGGLAFSNGSGAGPADFVLNVVLQRFGARLEADAALTKRGSEDLLWSSSLVATDPALLRQRVTYAAFRVLACATGASNDVRKLDGSRLRLLFSACNRPDFDGADDLAIALWRKVVQADPGNARALAMLGFVEAGSSDASEDETPSVLARRRIARSHLQAALAMDSNIGIAYAAEENLLPRWRYADRLDLLDRGIAHDPDCAALHAMKAQLLMDIGNAEQAINSTRRAVDLNPASTLFRNGLITTLAYAGYATTAAAELKDAERIWPDSPMIEDARARFDLRFGDANRLLRALDNGTAIPNMPTPWEYSLRDLLLARAQPTATNISAAIDAARRLAQHNDPQIPLQNLVYLGAIDEAYGILNNPRALVRLRHGDTDILFRAYMRPFQRDPRFPVLARELGLLQFSSLRIVAGFL